jgi:hypothetical protein
MFRSFTLIAAGILAASSFVPARSAAAQSVSEQLEQRMRERRLELGCPESEDMVQCELRGSLAKIDSLRQRRIALGCRNGESLVACEFRQGNARQEESAATSGNSGSGTVYYDTESLTRWSRSGRAIQLFCGTKFPTQEDCRKYARGGCTAVSQSEVTAATKKATSGSAMVAC